MSNVLSIIASVALSLASTNDYTFTSPGTTNLVGRGMGMTASYFVPRAEDIAFLREAYAERSCLLSGTTNSTQWTSANAYPKSLITRGHIPASGCFMHHWPWSHSNNNYCVSSFYPSFRGWGKMHYSSGGWGAEPLTKAFFVSPSFSVSASHHDVGPDYKINGCSTENSLSAFAGPNDAISPSVLYTNTVLRGVLRAGVVQGLYSNICINARVIHDAYYHRTGDTNLHPLSSINDTYVTDDIINHTYAYYTYVDSKGRTNRSFYETGYSSTGPVTTYYCKTNTDYWVDDFRMKLSHSKETLLLYDYKINDYEQPKKYKSLEVGTPLHYKSTYSERGFATMGKPLVRSDVLDVATNYVTEASCLLVMRMSVVRTESYSGSTTLAGSTSTTNYFVLTNNATIRKKSGSPMWEVDFDLSRINPVFDDGWVGVVSWPEVDVKHPEYMDDIPQTLSATHTREERIKHFDISLYVNFIPTFKARVLE